MRMTPRACVAIEGQTGQQAVGYKRKYRRAIQIPEVAPVIVLS